MTDDERRQLERIVALVRAVLGDAILGAYLHGSAVLGGLRRDSDLDVLIVTSRPTTADERRRLVDGLLPMSGRGDPSGRARSIELTVVVGTDVRPWRYPPRLDLMYGDWLRAGLERGEPAPGGEPEPDLAVLLAMVRRFGKPLLGPPASELLDPVPAADVARAAVAGIGGLMDDLEPDTRNVLLTLARIWMTVATGTIRPKDVAADWAIERLPSEHRPVLALARAGYLGEATDEPWAARMPAVRAHAGHVLGEIERAGRTRTC